MRAMEIGIVKALFLAGLAIGFVVAPPPIDTLEKAMAHLNRFGYLKDSEMREGMPMNDQLRRKALEYFQVFANITMTGTLDNATMEMMNKPRCGMPDMDDSEMAMMRRRRYTLVNLKWSTTDLTWGINSRPSGGLGASEVDRILEEALNVWSESSALTFEKRSSGENADIAIEFAKGNHGDKNPFDGRGGTLAHAYFPSSGIGGDAHFDDAEDFTDATFLGTNLFQVAVHEFGHSLGLGHSQVQDAIMYPYYRGYVPNSKLHDDDIQGIQALYDANSGNPEEKPTIMTEVQNCMKSITLATSTQDGSYYLANETHVYKLRNDYNVEGYPKSIGEEFPGLPDNLDAGFYYNGKTYMFKGNQYWRLTNQNIDSGYPRTLSTSSAFRGLPGDLDAAFVWSRNGRIYFIKGDQYYRLDSGGGVGRRYPRSLDVWDIPPSTIDAAFQYENGYTYFFSGTNYYRYNDYALTVDGNNYPKDTAEWWLGCDPSALEADGGAGATVPSPMVSLLLPFTFAVLGTATKLL